ncbi:MAG: hypothetical protein A2X64_08110 [Ignavibacteria bacterium GWF2_33_9]|nr:MAG: hypothetical protein A2X64_08110 [Ignavibacteria bacterium GWF2_33_9]
MLIGEIAALSTALFWSFASIFFTYGVNKVGVFRINIDRLFFATIYLILTIFFLNLTFDLSIKQYTFLVLSSIVGLVLGDTFLFKAFSMIGPRITILIMSFVPPVSAVMAYYFLGEGLGPLAILGIIVTVSGISLVIFDKDKETGEFRIKNKKGIIWAVLGLIGQASGLILAKVALLESEVNPLIASFVRIFSGWLLLVPIGIFLRRYSIFSFPYKSNLKVLTAPMIGAVLGPFLGITLSLVAINYAKIGIASTLMATTPILMLPISHFAMKEQLHWKAYAGAIVAVLGVAIIFIR